MEFKRKLLAGVTANDSLVCIGLDSDSEKLPNHLLKSPEAIFKFNKQIIDKTADLVCAYKLNSAFYEKEGAPGIDQLQKTCLYIHEVYPELPIIVDAKRADIGNTNHAYAQFIFDYLKADAVTLHPYLGHDALEPFLKRRDKGLIILCRTSNEGAGEFQDLKVNTRPLYEVVAERIAKVWNEFGNCFLVVGATYPAELERVRQLVGQDMDILVPGIGSQGGDIQKTLKAGLNRDGQGLIIHSAREIIFASDGIDFAEAARQKTDKLRTITNSYRV